MTDVLTTVFIGLCIAWTLVIVAGFAFTRLIGSKGRVRVEELRRERFDQWRKDHPRSEQ